MHHGPDTYRQGHRFSLAQPQGPGLPGARSSRTSRRLSTVLKLRGKFPDVSRINSKLSGVKCLTFHRFTSDV